jgi:hypothetical protein
MADTGLTNEFFGVIKSVLTCFGLSVGVIGEAIQGGLEVLLLYRMITVVWGVGGGSRYV